MPQNINNIKHQTDALIITANGLRRTSYLALWFLLLLCVLVSIFEPYLNQMLSGQLTIVSLLLATLIFVLTNMQSIRMAQRRQLLRPAKPNAALILIMESHLLLDAAIERQLNGIVTETEHAAMSIITAARNISQTTIVMRSMLEQDGSHRDLLAAIHDSNIRLSTNVTEILGQVQFQDVVRQRVKRALIAVQERNIIFNKLMQTIDLSELNLYKLAESMHIVLRNYLQNEKLHAAAFSHLAEQESSLPNIEFF